MGKKLTALGSATTLDGSELAYLEQGGVAKQATADQFADRALAKNANVSAFAGLTGAADKLAYFTGLGALALVTLTSFGRSLIAAANAAAGRTTLDVYSKAEVDAAISGAGGYSDEQAQDAVGSILTDTGLAVVTYSDATPSIDVNVPAAAGSDFRTGTDATKALTSDAAWDAAAYVALTDASTVAVDFSTGLNFTLTIGGNRTLGAPSNMKEGQTGVIAITQDGTGSRTLAYNSAWLFAGGTDPTLSTAAGAKDLLFYQVLAGATTVYGTLIKAIA